MLPGPKMTFVGKWNVVVYYGVFHLWDEVITVSELRGDCPHLL
jgi:hypothetical protein